MHTPPRVFFRNFDPTTPSAHHYYRIDVPARTLVKLGLAEVTTDTELFCRTETDFQSHILGVSNHDVYHCFATSGPAIEALQRLLRTLPAEGGHVPPCWITDYDDNLDFVHPLNQGFKELGTRLHDGTLLVKLLRLPPEDQVINILLEGTGEEMPLWTNGKDGFDILRNYKMITSLNRVARRSHGVTVPTDRLARYYRSALRHSNVYALPNSVIFEDYPRIMVQNPTPGRIRVMWHGGGSHYPDFYPMAASLREAARRFPEIMWVIWGADFRWLGKAFPEGSIERHEWVPYEAFRIKLAALHYDLAFIPLIEGPFNRFKSNIKWYESSALSNPKPVLAANVPPYKDEIQDGVTGMLFEMPQRADEISESFLTKLEALVRSEALREQLARSAKEWCASYVQASVTIPRWWKWVQETHERYRGDKLGLNAGLQVAGGAGDLRDDVRQDVPPA